MRKPLAVAVAILASATLVACGSNDVSVESRDRGTAEIVNMPDKFPNVATKCNHGLRVYVSNNTEAGAGQVAAVPDPNCPGGHR